MSRTGDSQREGQPPADSRSETTQRPEGGSQGLFAPTMEWPREPDSSPQETLSSQQKDPHDRATDAASKANPPVVSPDTYRIMGEIARGGLGRILKAFDRRLGRSVALKELLQSTPESSNRFLREALITAHLQHPSIVPVYEAGYWSDGSPFYAMKMVSGQSLQDVISQTRTLEDRLALLPNMIAIAEAVAYAHNEGIIHRDLKPANVLVGAFGETVVVDWGLAKRITEGSDPAEPNQSPIEPSSELTVIGSVVGTPAYMAPEQARGLAADKRGDVYALGAMLYHLLSGAPPYSGESGAQVLQQVVAGPRPIPLEQRQPRVPPDLATVVNKAMAPDPGDRYSTAAEFAADLKRFQTGQLVSAHVYSKWLLLRRWIRKRRATVTVAATLLLILAATAILSVQRIIRERNRAEARTHELILTQARTSLETDPTSTIAWLKTYPTYAPQWGAVRMIAADAYDRGIARRILRGHQAQVSSAVFTPDGKRIVSAGYDKTIRVWNLETGAVQLLSGHSQLIAQVAGSPNGKLLASASADGTVRLWDLATGEGRVLAGHQRFVRSIAFSPDGRFLASTGDDQTVRIWDTASGKQRAVFGKAVELDIKEISRSGVESRALWFVSYSPDGNSVAAIGKEGVVHLWNVENGQHSIITKHDGAGNATLFSPDGRLILSYSDDNTLRLSDLDGGRQVVLKGHTDTVGHATFSPDGRSIASASEDGTIRLWDTEGRLLRILAGHQRAVKSVAFSPDGRSLASGSTDNTVRVWNLLTGETRILRGHTSWIPAVQFSPDGKMLLSASWDETIRLWEVTPPSRVLFQGNQPIRSTDFSPSARLLAFAGDNGAVRIWDSQSDQIKTLTQHKKRVNRITFSPDNDLLASAADDGTIGVWRFSNGEARLWGAHEDTVKAVAFTPDGRSLISGSWDGTLRAWDIATGSHRVLEKHKEWIDDLAVSPDGQFVAAAIRDTTLQPGNDIRAEVRLRNLMTGEVSAMGGHSRRITRMTFSPDGHLLAVASDALRIWDFRSRQVRLLAGHSLPVIDLAFLGSTRLASGSRDSLVMLWDANSGQHVTLRGHESPISALAPSPEGSRLVSASWEPYAHLSTVRLWDLETGESRLLRGPTDSVNSISFSPDGSAVATASSDGSVRIWWDELPMNPEGLHQWMERATDARIEQSAAPAAPAAPSR